MTNSPYNSLNNSDGHSVLFSLLRAPRESPSVAAGRQQKQNAFLPWLQHCAYTTARGLVFEIKRTFTMATKL